MSESEYSGVYIFLLLRRLGGLANFTKEEIISAAEDVRDVHVYQDSDGLYLRIEEP
jgi:hypothetical protein